LGAYAGMYHLRVNGANYVGAISSLSPDGREVRREVFVEPKTGLENSTSLLCGKNVSIRPL
jgi:hypothetical protein